MKADFPAKLHEVDRLHHEDFEVWVEVDAALNPSGPRAALDWGPIPHPSHGLTHWLICPRCRLAHDPRGHEVCRQCRGPISAGAGSTPPHRAG